MSEGKQRLIDRFPKFAAAIQALFHSDNGFTDLCRSYGEVGREIDRLDQAEDPGGQARAHDLRRRRDALEAELRALIEQNVRV